MDEFHYPDELEIGSADYENATFKPKKLGLEECIEKITIKTLQRKPLRTTGSTTTTKQFT